VVLLGLGLGRELTLHGGGGTARTGVRRELTLRGGDGGTARTGVRRELTLRGTSREK